MKNPSDLNKWEKEVYGSLLKDEEEALEELKKMYESALNDIMDQVKSFDADISSLDELLQLAPDEAAGKILNLQQSKIYQKQYQEALQGQIHGILDRLNSEEYTSIDEYLKGCYEEGWTGSAYVLAQQGIPIITPIDQAAMTRAVLLDSKISNGLYEHLGVDVANLKKRITQEISRGIATGMSYRDIARNLNNTSKTGLSNAMRIVRTEGHRIQQRSWKDSAVNAKDHGADLVRVWSAVLDGRTRPTHRLYDGTITEVTEPFHLPNGKVVDRPSDFGDPSEDCNCRCIARSVPRWALDTGIQKMDNFTGQLRTFNSYDDYEKFKEDYWSDENIKYMQYVQKMEEKYGTTDFKTLLGNLTEAEFKTFRTLDEGSPIWGTSFAKVEIDELTPCLRRLSDNKIVATTMVDVKPTKKAFKDWEFDWTIPYKEGYTIRGIKAEGDARLQGLIAFRPDPNNLAVKIDIVESAPFNNPHNKMFVSKEYAGVGGHLFAEAVRESYENGFGGYVYFVAKSDLIEYYKEELGAIVVNPRLRVMAIEEESAKVLYERYYK